MRTLALKLEHHLFIKDGAWLQGVVPFKVRAALRRRVRAKFLLWDARDYHAWLKQGLPARRSRYACTLEPGLLSLLSPVWDGTPLRYFRLLAESIIRQNPTGAAEWVILDNGCHNQEILSYLGALKEYSWIKLAHSPENTGIIGGLRLCLEAATGRYIVPVDSDDLLYPDCLEIVTWWLQHCGYPPILYTDEDKVIESAAVQPYLKSDFDPVLLLNSPYIAHLGVIDRKLALEHGAYDDKSTEGSPDWDLFTRFFISGRPAVHIPEVVYSWRMHPESTAEDADSKPYIHSSQKAVLQRYLDTTGFACKFEVAYSPLLPGSCNWWLQRRALYPEPALLISLTTGATPMPQPLDYIDVPHLSLGVRASVKDLADLVDSNAPSDRHLVCLLSDEVKPDNSGWLWEALGLFERFPDTAMVGGRIHNTAGQITSAGYVLGFGRGCDCPERGRAAVDPGYFGQMLKQRSVSAVSSQFAVLRAGTVKELAKTLPSIASLAMLGEWVGAWALRNGKRVIYSPFLSGASNLDWEDLSDAEEKAAFQKSIPDLIPDHRFYSRAFGRQAHAPYHPSKAAVAR